jgi:hypothetical protein
MLLRIAVVALLTLAACNASDAGTDEAASADTSGWRTAAGKAPSKAEFAALAATCQDQAKDGSVDQCLADLGLKRAP